MKEIRRSCPYCAPAPECFERNEHNPMDSCPKCEAWEAELDPVHPECEASVARYTSSVAEEEETIP